MVAISQEDRQAFLHMAEQHFRELNPAFIPQDDWTKHYFENVTANSNTFARWIVYEGERVGFILYGLEKHRFLPRLFGMIYELYVRPEFRRLGVARHCALQAVKDLEAHAPSKIELEVTEGNSAARALWEALGFDKVSERFVLKK
jgi:ribosomal protein S18 acetylase RimI-like enzyme